MIVSKKYLFLALLFVSLFAFVLIGCGQGNNENATAGDTSANDAEITITTSFSVIADITQQVVGERGHVDYIVPIGDEPHEHEPVPSDFIKVSDSDVFFVHGMGLEEWLTSLMQNVSDTPVFELAEGVTPIPLEGETGDDPHAWLDPRNVEIYVQNIVDYLIDIDPEGEVTYTQNAAAYTQELQDLHSWIEAEVEQIPEEHRIIVLSENAFRYFGQAYGFDTEGIWELNSHEEGTTGQITRLVDIIKDRDIPAVFLETTVSASYMETVSGNSGVDIAGKIYTDGIGLEDSGADSYLLMMEHNVQTFVNGLK